MAIVENEGQPLQNRDYRQHLDKNWNNINQYEKNVNAQIKQVLSNPPKGTADELTQLRIDNDGNEYPLAKPRIDSIERDATYAAQKIDSKADKDYINNYLAQVNYSPDTIASLAELKSRYPTGKPGLYITADTGHKYIWTAGAWKDSGIYQSAGIADGGVAVNKLAPNAQSVVLIPSRDGAPNFDSKKRVFDFNCNTDNAYFMLNNTIVVKVPLGSMVKYVEPGLTSAKLVYDAASTTFSFIYWSQELKNTETLLGGMRLTDGGYVWSGSFDITVDNYNPQSQRGSLMLVPSRDGAPFYDINTNELNLNAITDNPYIIYNGKSYQVPIGAAIKGASGTSSFRFIINLTTMRLSQVAWNASVGTEWRELAAIRVTNNHEVLTSASFDIAIRGASYRPTATINARDAKVIGINHRGFNTIAPEESRAAYVMSKRSGYLHWEGDINWTKDNVPMMIHDLAINRTARNLDGTALSSVVNITDLNYADLKNYDFGIIKGKRFKGEPLITFEELLRLARFNDTCLHVEFKYKYSNEQVNVLHELVVKYNMLDRVAWQSFDGGWLEPMMTLEPRGQFEILGGTIGDAYLNRLMSYKTDLNTIVASQSSDSSLEDLQLIANKGFPIYLWTVNDGAKIRKYRDIVSGFLTDGSINVADELVKDI